MSECHKKAWNRQAQRRRGGERGGWRDLRRQTTDKKILSGKKGVFYSPFVCRRRWDEIPENSGIQAKKPAPANDKH